MAKKLISLLMALCLFWVPMALAEGEMDALEIDSDIEAMIPALDSLTRTLGIEGEFPYDAENATQVWSAVYMMGLNWSGEAHLGAEDTEKTEEIEETAADLLLSPQDALIYAQVMFADLSELPPLPELEEGEIEWIAYDEQADAYRLTPFDWGSTSIAIEDVHLSEQGTPSVLVSYSYHGGEQPVLLGYLSFVLGENSIEQLPFAYRVADVVLISLDK